MILIGDITNVFQIDQLHNSLRSMGITNNNNNNNGGNNGNNSNRQ